MLALLLIPALLGFALIIDSDDDTDDTETTGGGTVDPSGEDLGTGQTITTILEAGENSFDGTGANDRIDDTDEASEISGGAGNDFIQGRGGFDTIDGGTGNDTIFAAMETISTPPNSMKPTQPQTSVRMPIVGMILCAEALVTTQSWISTEATPSLAMLAMT